MGYTHYWTFKAIKRGKTKAVNKAFNEAVLACQKIVSTYNKGRVDETRLAGYTAHTEPGDYLGLNFNGTAELSHEAFIIRDFYKHSLGVNFCKTDQKPYDIVVTACLTVLKHYLGDQIDVSSDGDAADWHDGLLLAKKITGIKELKNPIKSLYSIRGA